MDDQAKLFMVEIEHDPWAAITEPLREFIRIGPRRLTSISAGPVSHPPERYELNDVT